MSFLSPEQKPADNRVRRLVTSFSVPWHRRLHPAPADSHDHLLEPHVKSNLLLHHDLVVLKNKSASDAAQVPAAGAIVKVYVAGPRVHENTILRGQNLDPPPPYDSSHTG